MPRGIPSILWLKGEKYECIINDMDMKKIVTVCLLALAGVTGMSAATRSNKTEVARNLDIFNALVKELQLNYVDTIDAKKSINTAIFYMLDEIDPYTEYYSSDDQEQFNMLSTGEYGGIGCVITKGRDGRIYFAEPYEGTPSQRAGVRGGDVILQIDSDTLSTKWDVARTSEKLRGPAGTVVKVRAMRPYVADSIVTFEIERAKIVNPAVTYYGTAGTDGKTGYIALSAFTDKAAGEVRDALVDLMENHGVTSLVLDLRGNPGGLLESAVQIAGLFVPKGTEIVRTRGRGALSERVYKTIRKPVAPDMPLAVLIDGGSASSSEIVAGSLQDLDRAVIVGARSFGKGLVQSSRTLPFDGVLKLTTAKYYIPSGRLIQAIDYSRRNEDGSVARMPDSLTTVYNTVHGRPVRDGGGITPDVVVESPKINRLLYNIRRDNWDNDFATMYAASHDSIPAATEFVVTDSIFAGFKRFIDPDKFAYDRACDSILKQLREAVEVEGYKTPEVDGQIDALETMLHHDLEHDLDVNREILNELISDAIVRRYYYQKGAVANSMRYNKALHQALKLLENREEYCRIISVH